MRGPDPYTLADDPATPPQMIILPGNQCVTPDGQEVPLMSWMGVRTWGNSPVGSTVMLSGTYELEGEVSRRVLGALPPLLVLPAEAWQSPLVGLLAEEIVKDDPGQEAVLDRLLDLVLIAVLRAWFARPDAEAPALVPRIQRSRSRKGAAADPQRARPPMDGRRTGCRGGRLAGRSGPPLQRAGRRAADDVPHRLAAVTCRRPPAGTRHDDRLSRVPGRILDARSHSAPRSSGCAASARKQYKLAATAG